jgi:hypothetical protein
MLDAMELVQKVCLLPLSAQLIVSQFAAATSDH